MKKVLFIISVLISSLFITAGGYKRYYTKANSYTEACNIAKSNNLKLESYSEGIAVLYGNYQKTNTLAGTYDSEVTESIIYKDSYCIPTKINTLNSAPEDNRYWYSNSAAFKSTNWLPAYYNGITGKGVTVAVLDSGCLLSHPDLAGAIVGTYNAVDNSNNVTDYSSHGTNVAGIIAARDNYIGICGFAPECSLYIMKVSSSDGFMWHSNIIRALNKCADDPNISVINMSFYGGIEDDELKVAIENCLNKGKICVMAAGNASSKPNKAPACFGLGLIVGYYSNSGSLGVISNYGGTVNILAPGSLWSTNNKGGYTEYEGTSIATPVISATAALVYSKYSISKNITGTTYVQNLILNNRNSTKYTYDNRVAYGGVDIANIFKVPEVAAPNYPIIGVNTDWDNSKQARVTISSNSTEYDIYYTLDYSNPSATNGYKYTGPFFIDTPGENYIRAVALNKNRYSEISHRTFTVSNNVITKEQIESVEIYTNKKKKSIKASPGEVIQLKIKNKGKKIPIKKFKWKSSNKKLATVKNGKVKVSINAKKGKKVKILANLGGIEKYITIKIK